MFKQQRTINGLCYYTPVPPSIVRRDRLLNERLLEIQKPCKNGKKEKSKNAD